MNEIIPYKDNGLHVTNANWTLETKFLLLMAT